MEEILFWNNGFRQPYWYIFLYSKLMVNHPDAGETDMTYDAAGNLLTKLTAELRKSISDKGYISYTYDFERLHEVLYPENLFNRVTYTYGKAGDKYNRAGRLALVEDASGGEAYYYGRQGEVTKTVRTVMASVADIRTYVYGATYDSWNRVQTMTYPDGEVVTYHYNAAGQVESMTSNKQGRQSVIVDRIGYDKEGHTVYTKLGNGTETTYTYDKQRERLQVMNLTADGQTVMENRYQYDAVDNILGITNAANPASLTKLNKAKLGGKSSHTYEYDELNRLVHANGKAKSASYDMVMSFGRMSEPLTKVQKVDSTTTAKSYNFAYKYEDSNHPTAPTQIGHDHYTYDANGNPTLVTNDSTNTTREMYWDEDNRLMVLSDNGKTSRYTYNAAGERIMKSYGTMEGVYINGAPQGITFHETDNFTLYPASIISINKNRFTKHYFIGDKRVASRIGTGLFNNVYGRNGSYVTAGQQDYAERMNQIQKQKEAYYKQQGIAPGVPTEKGAYGDPENTGVGYNAVLTELGNHDVPQGWIQTPRPNTTPNTNPGPPVSWNDPSNPDDPQAGYGYIPNDTTREETFFYHSDHLGSMSYITDDKANITQYDAYLPYGELLVDEHSSSEDLPYKFNGKQFDEETGLYYYGARYMNPITSLWYGVDPLAEKYANICSYTYCHDNPIRLIDPTGLYDEDTAKKVASERGAQYYKDKESGEWFVAMDETRTKAYTTGGTLTRDFGPKKLPIIVDNMIVNDFSTPIAGLADFAAYKRTKDVSKIYNSMFTQYLYNGRLTQIDQTGKIWRNANTSQLVNQTLNKKLPMFTRYSNIFGWVAAIPTTLDIGGSIYKGLTSSTIQDQSYYLTEGVLKTPSYIPYLGTLWGLGFDHAVRPTWENGAKNIDNAIKHGADPSIIFIIPGLGYVPSTK